MGPELALYIAIGFLVWGFAIVCYYLIDMYKLSKEHQSWWESQKQEKVYPWPELKVVCDYKGEEDKYFFIHSDNTRKCPFCGGTDIRGGSWAPDVCINCYATYFFGTWFLDKYREKVMFDWSIEYLVSYGASCVHVDYYNCKATTPYGAWRKFLRDTKKEDHYSSREYRNSFLNMLREGDIKIGKRHYKEGE